MTLLSVLDLVMKLHAWQRLPNADRRAAAEAALAAVAAAAGARGARLTIGADPSGALVLGTGTLTDPAVAPPPAAATAPLVADGSPEPLGMLVLDGAADPSAVGRAIAVGVEDVRERAIGRARMARMLEATRAVNAELDLDRLLALVVGRAREVTGAAYAALGIADERGRLERFVTSGMEPEQRAAIGHPPVGHGLLGLIIREARSLRVVEIGEHPAHHGFPEHHPPMHSFLGVPILVRGRSVGNLYLTEKLGGEPFTDEDEALVELFAGNVGVAIENARLHDQVRRLAVVEERERIGKDLHDGVIQAIYGVGLSLEDLPELLDGDATGRTEALARVDRAIDSLNLVIADIRAYILRLRPSLTGDEDPVEALARLGEELRMHAVVDLETHLDGGAPLLRAMAPDRAADLLFIVREALSNIARHAGATRALLEIARDEDDLVVRVEDNGRGFDPARVAGPDALGRHQGLANMRDRAVGLGGSFVVERPSGPGTRIIIRVAAAPAVRGERGGIPGREIHHG